MKYPANFGSFYCLTLKLWFIVLCGNASLKTPKRWQQIEIFDITFSLINDLNFSKKNVLERLNINFLIFKLASPNIRLRLELMDWRTFLLQLVKNFNDFINKFPFPSNNNSLSENKLLLFVHKNIFYVYIKKLWPKKLLP